MRRIHPNAIEIILHVATIEASPNGDDRITIAVQVSHAFLAALAFSNH